MKLFSTKYYASKSQNINDYLTGISFISTQIFLKRYAFTDDIFNSVLKR